MKFTGPKAKRCRRQGSNIYGSDKYDRVLQHKAYGPGKGPRSRTGRQSEYAKQLIEKQKVRDIYGLSEKQFYRLYCAAASASHETSDTLKQFLERRFDNVLYRAGFALTRLQSRQLAGHGLFLLNGLRITCPSHQVEVGDVIEVRTKSKSSTLFPPILAAHEKYLPPKWMKVDSGNLRIEIIALPDVESAEQAIDIRQVIEFYSRS